MLVELSDRLSLDLLGELSHLAKSQGVDNILAHPTQKRAGKKAAQLLH